MPASKSFFPLLSFLFLLIACGLAACGKEDPAEASDRAIRDYLEANMIEAESTTSGLYYRIIEPGNGQFPSAGDEVAVFYRGYLLDGFVFDSRQRPDPAIEFSLNNVIAGWREGIPLIDKGGEIQLFVPSQLGYGDRQAGNIPPNSVLIFDVELIDFE